MPSILGINSANGQLAENSLSPTAAGAADTFSEMRRKLLVATSVQEQVIEVYR